METNLINNYINSNKPDSLELGRAQAKSRDKINFVTIVAKNDMKPLAGSGKLLRPSIIGAPMNLLGGISYDMLSLKSGMSGESNDHQLGKLNDLGMKVGGLAIASYLFTKNSAPTTKWMEFIGAGSFFASMALWPKLALQLPAKLIHGVDVRQQYQDSMGRKKFVYSDPQFIPWDLYSDKEINKIGDKLRVDKAMPNRREFVQEKMKKIALQNNTLWMLTAGFATPIMSALICNQAEKFVKPINHKLTVDAADDFLKNFDKHVEKANSMDAEKNFAKTLNTNQGKPLTKKLIAKIVESMHTIPDNEFRKCLVEDLSRNLLHERDSVTVTEALIKEALTTVPESLKQGILSDQTEEMKKYIPTLEEAVAFLKEGKFIGRELDPTDANSAAGRLSYFIQGKIAAVNVAAQEHIDEGEDVIVTSIIKKLESVFKPKPTCILDENAAKTLQAVAKTVSIGAKEAEVLCDYARLKVAEAPETVIANNWNEITGSFVKMFGITPKEIEKTRYDRESVQKMFRTKLETITSDDKEYTRVINELAQKIKVLSESITEKEMVEYEKILGDVYNSFGAKLSVHGLDTSVNKAVALEYKVNELRPIVEKLNQLRADRKDIKKDKNELAKIEQEMIELDERLASLNTNHADANKILTDLNPKLTEKSLLESINQFEFIENKVTEKEAQEILKGIKLSDFSQETLRNAILKVKGIDLSVRQAQDIHRKVNETAKLSEAEMKSVLDRLQNIAIDNIGSISRSKKEFFEGRINGVRSAFYRLIDTLDIYRRISKGDFGAVFQDCPIEVQEELIELIKQTSLQGHSVDYSVKLPFKRNVSPDRRTGNVVVENGVVKNQFYNPENPKNVLISYDSNFFKRAMRFMYGNKIDDTSGYAHQMDSVTVKALEDAGLLDKQNKYNKEFYVKIGNNPYPFLPEHISVDFRALEAAVANNKRAAEMMKNSNSLVPFEQPHQGKYGGVIIEKLEELQHVNAKAKEILSFLNQKSDAKAETTYRDIVGKFKNLAELEGFIQEKLSLAKKYTKHIADYKEIGPSATADEKTRLIGVAIDEMFTKVIQGQFNTKKWLKMFGVCGAGLLGVTVAAQFFFGKIDGSGNKVAQDSRKVEDKL